MSLKEVIRLLPDIASEIQMAVSCFNSEVFLGTNQALIDAGDACTVSDKLSGMIADVDTVVASLLEGRKTLEEHRRWSANLSSAVFRVPVEIMSRIFIMSSEIEVDFGKDGMEPSPIHIDFERGHSVALNVAQVCRRWREIAFYTPQLWSLIPLFRLDRKGMTLRDYSPQLYERVGSFPVHLLCNPMSPQQLFDFDAITLSTMRPRCTGLDIDITSWRNIEPKTDDIADWIADFTALRRLTVKVPQVYPAGILSPMSHLPTRLTHLYLCSEFGELASESSVILRFRWDCLKTLIIEGFEHTNDTFWRQLSVSAPMLEELFLKGFILAPSGNDDQGGPLIHPRLRTLCLVHMEEDMMGGPAYTLPHVSSTNLGHAFPALSHLSFSWSPNFAETVKDALARIKRPLLSLTLLSGETELTNEHEDWLSQLGGECGIESVGYVKWWHNWSIYASVMEKWYDPYIVAKASASSAEV
ncbi:hypothetical protein CONPUDRAFT_140603 [Coniophora puteana RWD-64-598 SS2]|uniref:Uncharacterized protein n=1 Tax=Coniophora puteana (strain RWD-64-598) TaxID=741705 RepID=R7SDL3_CONPW|nr:uncharacterized protein CONPUDRAFT_140603 [Coniophora puteana RWD-64-598 SS2]EIW74253.1 hypothetical protein CONPUDRAFT_140603 [Coniophora puteana RWD-64-598 SS2]